MAWENTDIFGSNSAGTYDFGGTTVSPTFSDAGIYSGGNNGGLLDEVVSFGKDIFSGYLDLKSKELLMSEQTKLLLAQQQQNNLLSSVERPVQTNAQTLTPEQIASLMGGSAGSSSNNQLLILAAIVGVAFLVM